MLDPDCLRPGAAPGALPHERGARAYVNLQFSNCLQRPADSLQSFAEHFVIHSHADAEVVGQTKEASGDD